MSRRWIQNPNRCSDEYLDGIEDFIEFARRQNPGATRIRCPCRKCNNTLWETIENVGFHLVRNGMIETYSIWNLHGEQLDHASSSNATRMDSVEPIVDHNDQVMDIIEDVFPFASTNINNEREDDVPTPIDSAEFEQYEKLLKNANQELYPGCESFSVLTAIVELMHGKIKYRMSNLCFDYFLGVFKRMLPTDNCLPKDHKQAQKVLNGLGLGYEKIHACKNNCMLFYKEHETLDTCLICNESRFKMTSQNRTTKIPQKVMRYLPLKPRLQRLYMSTHTATDMRWHKEKQVDDDVMRHPADGEAWKEFDRTFPEFAADPRNVRLGLATDGFNPYGVLNQHHSTWPIFVFPYNLPPWKCMKKEYMMMTVLITEDPGRSIDVYLRPLVDELKDLWTNGVRTYDKSTGKMFTLRAAVMWTVNDFPAYAMVSGWSTKGYMACPVCKEDVTSGWHAGKVCYLGHRRWLPWDHEWREKDKEFDGNTERRLRPREWSGDEIVEQLNRLDFAPFGKTVNRIRPSTHMNWTHKPMFFELPYWSKLKLRHNLDVMHVEKNVFDTLVGTILDIEGKTKDTIKARLDLERMGIRRGLWMNRDSDKARRDLAFLSLKPNDKKEFLKFVSSVKFPDGYASNIARCVNVDRGKFTGLKSNDCHVFMQRLLPVGIRHLLPEDVVKPIMLLSRFFSQLTAKTLRKTDILQLRHDIVQFLCKFEMIFPPAFFTSMMHVMVHLPEEALLAGPVNYRWMYPIERLLGELKKSVRNRAKPEGSIIKAWVQYESLTFCGIFLKFFLPPSLSPPPPLPPTSVDLDRARHIAGAPELPRRHRRASRRDFFGFHRIGSAVILPPPATNSDTSGVFGLEFGCRLRLERILPIVRFPGLLCSDRWIELKLTYGMSDLIRRRRAVTTTQSSEPPTQPTSAATAPASAATAPALMDHLAVGPARSQAPTSSASSVAQPVSARRRHRPAAPPTPHPRMRRGSQPERRFSPKPRFLSGSVGIRADVANPSRILGVFDLVCGATRIASGEYPLRMLAILGRQLSKFTRAQSKLLAGSLDFLGINYYASYYASDAHKSSYSSYTTDSRVTFSCE
ncbi:hypothetical protein L3X38_030285 [Prunus dulcis]|uniref:Ankyrin repeat family protein n=1 Tax=Prunus dulcis TaxID=3755 RepID=A0AAD4VB51_PRUDU|nr:hypothetical protein L3X38_030285 [Prunus dulcis]